MWQNVKIWCFFKFWSMWDTFFKFNLIFISHCKNGWTKIIIALHYYHLVRKLSTDETNASLVSVLAQKVKDTFTALSRMTRK